MRPLTVHEAGKLGGIAGGRKGGLATWKKHGRKHYQEIGKKGGAKVRELIARGKANERKEARK